MHLISDQLSLRIRIITIALAGMADVWIERLDSIDYASGSFDTNGNQYESFFSLNFGGFEVQALRSQLAGVPQKFITDTITRKTRLASDKSEWPALADAATTYLEWCAYVDPNDLIGSFDRFGYLAEKLTSAYSNPTYGANLNSVVLNIVHEMWRIYGRYEVAAKWISQLMFRLYNSIRSDRSPERPKNKILLPIAALLLRSYFALDRYRAASAIFGNTPQSGLVFSQSPMQYRIEYRYWLGRYYLFRGDVYPAFRHLRWAVARCPLDSRNYRTMLEWLLIPAILCGYIPNAQVLRKTGLDPILGPIIASLKSGKRLYDHSINHSWITSRHLRPLLEAQLPILVCRRALQRMLHLIKSQKGPDTVTMTLTEAQIALSLSGAAPSPLDNEHIMAESVCEALIKGGYLKANLMPQSQVLRLKKDGAFPPVRKIAALADRASFDEAWFTS